MASEIVVLGGFDEGDFLGAERLRLPLLDYVGGIARMKDALDCALTVRKGIPVLGKKGVGKSVAVDCAVQAFQRRELEARRRDHKYQPRRVVVIPTLRADKYRDAVLVIGQAITGTLVPVRAHGRRRGDDELRDDLLNTCRLQRVVALIIGEGEYLTAASRAVLRDLMGNSEDSDPHRRNDAGIGAAGLAILLVGTPPLLNGLQKSEEFGHRWLPPVEIPGLTPADVPRVYRDWVPGFEAHIAESEAATPGAWAAYIAGQFPPTRMPALRTLDHHVRLYMRRMMRQARHERRPAPTLGDVAFNDNVFRMTLQEARRGSEGDRGSGASAQGRR
jgi:hypothetical protein